MKYSDSLVLRASISTMVKNTTGGSKHKGMARKAVNASKQRSRLRKIEEEGEAYAVVIKLMGGARCSVLGMDNVERDCIIRGKFRGKGKRDNTIRAGVLVLVGDREWSTTSESKRPVCDLLEVYSDIEKERLKKDETSIDWKFVLGVGEVVRAPEITEDIEFGDNVVDEEYHRQIAEETGKASLSIAFGYDEEVGIDDI